MRCDEVSCFVYILPFICFNPYWVFQCAATNLKSHFPKAGNGFQSLLGFPMRCDTLGGNSVSNIYRVSIPIGFSNALRLFDAARRSERSKYVSIPIGFSNALRQHCGKSLVPIEKGFNPYWVFQCAATARMKSLRPLYLVSIPIGFSNALRHIIWQIYKLRVILVSIPIGFSNALRQHA